MTKIYIAGPMTGHLHHNFPAFFAAEEMLKPAYDVVNPARLSIELAAPIFETCYGIPIPYVGHEEFYHLVIEAIGRETRSRLVHRT